MLLLFNPEPMSVLNNRVGWSFPVTQTGYLGLFAAPQQ